MEPEIDDSISLHNGAMNARIEKGELVGFSVDGHEFIHQKGRPGWGNSDTEMFPIIGPVDKADFQVTTPRGTAVQDQHGILRNMEYSLLGADAAGARYLKTYVAHSEIANAKYPEKSTAEALHWPYDFKFTKIFKLLPHGLEVSFVVQGDAGMPYMIGYHPAFSIGEQGAVLRTVRKDIALAEVMAVGNNALPLMDAKSLILSGEKDLELSTMGFKHFMAWSPTSNMICVEPITFYPYTVAQKELHQGFEHLGEAPRLYSMLLRPI